MKKMTGINKINKWSSIEFEQTGYVTLSNTLYDNIYQVQAGECIVIDHSQNQMNFNRYRYYDFLHKVGSTYKIGELFSLMDYSINNVFRRLDHSTKNKTLVVPLSGGLDSRLIISNIHKIGRKNVLCFFYGRKNSREELVSKSIARELSYNWVSVEYTKKKWNECFNDGSFAKYFRYAGNGSSLPHIQDFLAIKELKNRSLLPENSVFIPGHTGDFISGGHIPNMHNLSNINKESLVNSIIDKHYILWIIKNYPHFSIINKYITSRVKHALKSHDIISKNDLANIFENWEWKERQSKFIINSCRVYEFYGFEWRLPLWDLEFINYWSRIPLEMRENKKLYKEYLLNSNYKNLFSDFNYKNFEKNNFKSFFKKTSIAKYLLSIYNRYYAYYHFSYNGMVKFSQLLSIYRFRYNINSIMIVYYLKMLNKDK
jgi:asparagine synthase (glutamine-hydrolysing)